MSSTNTMVKTGHADIAVAETSGKGLPIILIHGNSACKEMFRNQMQSEVGMAHRMVAIDLPGHGASSDAFDPERTYSMLGYADAVGETLSQIGVDRAVVCGWSLGGHVGMELMPRFSGMAGLMITGAPPVGQSAEEIQAGFRPTPHIGLAGKPEFSEEDVEIFVRATCGEPVDQVMRDAIVRTDGRARALMFASLFTGQASDERDLAINATVPIAVVNGADDPLVNVDYVGSLPYRNLWDNHCYVLRGAGHAPFMQAPDAFNKILGRYVADMDQRSTRPVSRGASKTAAA